MVRIITAPPKIVSKLGCSLIISQTQNGPIIVSSKKNKFTSSAGIYLGAIVTKTNGMATHIMHISGTIIRSVFISEKLSTKKYANTATQSLPITAEGTKSLFLAYLAITALQANPKADEYPE